MPKLAPIRTTPLRIWSQSTIEKRKLSASSVRHAECAQLVKSLVLRLAIRGDELLRLYSGDARVVVAVAENGQTVRFPANILREYVDHDGVHGRFRIDFAESGKFSAMSRLSD